VRLSHNAREGPYVSAILGLTALKPPVPTGRPKAARFRCGAGLSTRRPVAPGLVRLPQRL